jgi:hypothetical protein
MSCMTVGNMRHTRLYVSGHLNEKEASERTKLVLLVKYADMFL